LLPTSVTVVLRQYANTQGSRVVDDSDNKRCNVTKHLFKVHKLKDKTSGGYVKGQTLVSWLLVTPKVTMPVGVAFYLPDPTRMAWKNADEQFKKQGVPPQTVRPSQPGLPHTPPQAIALHLLAEF
jgi:hypothetical protein